MSTVAPARADHGAGLRLGPAETATVRRLLALLGRIFLWVVPIVTVQMVALGAVLSYATTVTHSMMEIAAQAPRWWLFTAGIVTLTSYLPVLIMHGMTRRAAFRALVVVGVLASLLWSVLVIVGHVVERFVYGRLGWSDRMTTAHLFTDGYDVPAMLLEYGLIFLAYTITGALIGACYYRYGGIRGTLLLAPAGVAGATIEAMLTGWDRSQVEVRLFASRPTGLLVLASLVLLALVCLVLYLVVRDVPIRSKK